MDRQCSQNSNRNILKILKYSIFIDIYEEDSFGLGDWEEGKEEYGAEKLIENWISWESQELNGQKRNEDKTCED